MDKTSYKELLKTKEWKEYRERILVRDNYICKNCGSTKYLNVHHIKYIRGRKPWEYPEELLVTLCRDCHSKVHNIENTPSKQEESNKNFFMVFTDNLGLFFSIKSERAKSVLLWMCCNAEFNTGVVYLPAPRMEEMSEFLNMPKQSIYNNIVQLKKLGLLTGERGKFMINPEVFWKGDIQTRRQLLESNGGAISVTFSITPNEDFNNE